ncbi:MAG: DNA-3-methyladenine glycosylase 2 family protein [Alphaproteobacteria bacterium]|nr:MAG: DNA-3-methyladenine glycosylase 2 family protein [Alphaproteobacteria bacterium]
MSENGQTEDAIGSKVVFMELSRDDCYKALKARDPRFDGTFFTCVSSTGIYCRPICPATTPKLANCEFVSSAAAAEDAGFRPCLRCRPETAPGSPAWHGTGSTVARAIRLLNEHDANGGNLEELSDRLGIGTRHLRRLFHEQLGASPKMLIQTQRLHVALHLLKETETNISDIAHASGFRSIRRFNDAMRKTVGMSPSEFRARHQLSARVKSDAPLTLRLGYRPPYDWTGLMSYLRMRAVAGMEVVSPTSYTRSIRIENTCGILHLEHDPRGHAILARFDLSKPTGLGAAARRVRDMMDTDCRPDALYNSFQADRLLRPLIKKSPGVRVPGTWDIFELIVRAVIGQQISVKGATTLLGRLVTLYGAELEAHETSITHAFPTPQALADADLTGIGLTTSRASTLRDLAKAFCENPGFVHPAQEVSQARERLTSIKGIGTWTADYVALRGLKYPDAFPAADLGLLRAAGADTAKDLAALSQGWRPWRGYAALLLWHSLS